MYGTLFMIIEIGIDKANLGYSIISDHCRCNYNIIGVDGDISYYNIIVIIMVFFLLLYAVV